MSRISCVVRDVFDGTPHDPTVLTQGHSPEFASPAVSEETGPRIPRSNPYTGLESNFRLGHSGRGSDLSFSSFFHEKETKFGKGTEKACSISLESRSAHFKDTG